MLVLRTLLFLLPFGLDTLSIAIGLGIKSAPTVQEKPNSSAPSWLGSALLFSVAEAVMPLIGIVLGSAVALALSDAMSVIGPLLLVGVGLWELTGEVRERLEKRQRGNGSPMHQKARPKRVEQEPGLLWLRQLMLVLSISLDELAVGFSLGGLAGSRTGGVLLTPFWFCVCVGIQSFIVTGVGFWAGRVLRARLKPVRECSEILAALLLIGLGVWLFFI